MKTRNGNRARAKAALRAKFSGPTDNQGYVIKPEANLIPGVRLDQFESDLRRGDGGELRMKFCAVHSSSALAANCFGPFKDRREALLLLGQRGAVGLEFEKRLPIIPGHRPSNLDVWVDRGASAVAVESKFLEYFQPKRTEFAETYKCMAPPMAEPCWWTVCVECSSGAPQYLDRAQLVKHYFGLRRRQQATSGPPKLTLLYLFWEPENWDEIEECREHRRQLQAFAEKVATSSISFRSMTYGQLWQEWMENPDLAEHACNLKARYEISI